MLWAEELELPVCLHIRKAHNEVFSLLRDINRPVWRGVMHCFSGSLEIARELVKMDWYIGVDGPLTFKNAAKLPEIVKEIPLERILVETDCPYMAPSPMRGKRNEPAFVRYVAEKLAELKGIDYQTVARQTTINAKALYTRLK
jgi:TatD DNase family protein